VKSLDGPVPTTFALNQNYPNPFNPSTTIEFALPQRETVRLDVFDILGRQVSTLVNAEMSAGTWRVVWNGKDANGSPVATGMYIYRIQAGSFSMVKKMLMIK
jgi:flagellar hook assembly protein FlgD